MSPTSPSDAIATSSTLPRRQMTAVIAVLSLGAFTYATNFGLFAPLLRPIAADLGKSDAAVGQLVTLHGVMTGFTALLITPWMDRFHRGLLLRTGALLLLLGTLGTALAPSFAWLFPARLLAGVGAAFVMPVCLAVAGEMFREAHHRNRAVSLVVAATALGPILGLPVLTQMAAITTWRWTVASLAVLILIVIAGSFWIPERSARRGEMKPASYLRHYQHVVSRWETNWLLAGHLLRGVAWYSVLIFVGAYAVTAHDFTASRLSLLYITLGSVFFASTNLVPYVLRLIQPRHLYLGAIVVLCANYLCVGLINAPWGLFLFVVVLAIAGAGISVPENVLLLESHPEARGGVMALRSANVEFSAAAGAVIVGLVLVVSHDYTTVFRVLGLLVPLCLLTMLVSGWQRRTAPEQRTPSVVTPR